VKSGKKMSRKLYPHLPNHKLETVSRYLLGKIMQADADASSA
jgi:hypothetical protein